MADPINDDLVGRLEIDGERPFVVTVIAERPGNVGYRTGIIWAATEDEAVGRWMRFATDENPGWTISTPAAIHITADNLERARERHRPTAGTGSPVPLGQCIEGPFAAAQIQGNRE